MPIDKFVQMLFALHDVQLLLNIYNKASYDIFASAVIIPLSF